MTPADKAAAALFRWRDLNNAQCQHPIDAEQSDRDALAQYIKASIGRMPVCRTATGKEVCDRLRDAMTDELFAIEARTADRENG